MAALLCLQSGASPGLAAFGCFAGGHVLQGCAFAPAVCEAARLRPCNTMQPASSHTAAFGTLTAVGAAFYQNLTILLSCGPAMHRLKFYFPKARARSYT